MITRRVSERCHCPRPEGAGVDYGHIDGHDPARDRKSASEPRQKLRHCDRLRMVAGDSPSNTPTPDDAHVQPGDVHKMAPLLDHYETFFATDAGASAPILGLLVVAVSVVNADDADARTRERRTVLAGSASLLWSTSSSSHLSR